MSDLFSKQCKSCGAPIIWVKSLGGADMPLDAEPEKRFILDGAAAAVARTTYTSHFATCPNADQHRKRD